MPTCGSSGREHDNPTSQSSIGDQRSLAGEVQTGGGPDRKGVDAQRGLVRAATPLLNDPTLDLAAVILDDIERVRTANENRLRQLTRTGEDEDGIERGFGLTLNHPDVQRLAHMVAGMKCDSKVLEALTGVKHEKRKAGCCQECDAERYLTSRLKANPLGAWLRAQRGVGDKQAARLLAKIGDPAVRSVVHEDGTVTHEWRTVSQLWAFAGLHTLPAPDRPCRDNQAIHVGGGVHNIAARRQKGQQANWSTPAKTRTWLVIASTMKQIDPGCKTDTGIGNHTDECACSPYRVAIDRRRHHTAVTHPEWTPGHSLADGQRIACKRFLRDLWREARRLHNIPG